MERFLRTTYDGEHALPRVEWSRGWARTDEEAWSDAEVLGTAVPTSFDDGEEGD
ncbi:cholesterol oxidase substrate-binding domain-containing protein [Streptomyces sp. NPDC058251]|uniref:cholesterol oxidase substrate-binding domain-containing protein n=1 Tax=unclassified Streptomyces TaxID=2593676 RepID=UPI0036ED88D9